MTTQFCRKCGAKLAPKNRFCPVCGAEVIKATVKTRQKQRSNKKSRRKSRSSNSLALWAVVAGVILLVIVGALALTNNNSPTPAISEIPDSHDVDGIPYPEVARISVSEAKSLYDAGSAIFVDVRSQGEYDTAHVAKALSLPLADLEARYRELPKDATIITYCT